MTVTANHPIRVVTLSTAERVLCLFTDVRDESEPDRVLGYKMAEPFNLSLGDVDENGNYPVKYNRWCSSVLSVSSCFLVNTSSQYLFLMKILLSNMHSN